MQLITSRNIHGALAPLLQLMHVSAEQENDRFILREPVIFTFDRPRERLIFYPDFRRNPAHELGQALLSLSQAEASIEEAATAVISGASHFLFSTPHLVVRGDIDHGGRFNLSAVIAEKNPFAGAIGQLGLQMSILQELLANSAKKPVGILSVQHMGLEVNAEIIKGLLRGAYDGMTSDPYDGELKPRKIDSPVELKMLGEEGAKAIGYKSKWVRQVALPLLIAGKAETPEEALELTKNIKANDWRRAMIEWTETVIKARAAQANDKA
jgi:hypothetical protein